ncbi:hypothetical protein AOLI_G00218290 [Acnodon oligacanthus]
MWVSNIRVPSRFKLTYLLTGRGLWRPALNAVRAISASGGPSPPFTTLAISQPATHITHVELHCPEEHNTMNWAFWSEMVDCFNQIAQDSECRVVVFSGAGKLFTAGIDLMDMAGGLRPKGDDTARKSWKLRQTISKYQETFSVIEKKQRQSIEICFQQ